MSRPRLVAAALALQALAVAVHPATAAWPHQPTANLAVSTATGEQAASRSISDGAGGTIIVWHDARGGLSYDIYAQRISATGVPLWMADGVAVCTAASNQTFPAIVGDGAGGAIVAWQDIRDGIGYDIYAQHVGADGAMLWAADGIVVCGAANYQDYASIVTDGSGGAVVVWEDQRGGANLDIYAQRLGADGTPQWTTDGVALCTAAADQVVPATAADGTGGAVVTWADRRSGTSYDIYTQRLGADGVPQWTTNGLAVCALVTDQFLPALLWDSTSGVIVSWGDYRNGVNYDLYAQRISPAGVPQWVANGLAVSTAAGDQYGPVLVADGAGGAVVSWGDKRNGSSDIFAQRLSSSGVPQWTANGAAVCLATGDQFAPALLADGLGGALFMWADERNGTYVPDIFGQRVNGAGTSQWAANGSAISTQPGSQSTPSIVSDGTGGGIVCWQDYRGGAAADIYAQRIEQFGKLGNPEPAIVSVLDIPNDQGGRVRVAWDASYLDRESDADLTAYDIFRSVPPNVAQAAIARGDSRHLALGEVPVAGDHAYAFSGAGIQQLAWEYVATATAQHFIATYGSTQATTSDSVAASNPATAFLVVGRNAAGTKYWPSASADGYSVDNLPPAAPAPFSGQYAAGTTRLHWDRNREADLAGYRLYRGPSPAFVPAPGNLVAALADTGYADAAGAAFVYKLTAIDAHGNESPVATLVPDGALGVGDTPAVVFGLAIPAPNPASGSATLDFTLSRAGSVRLALYDDTGRRIRLLHEGELPAGAHRETVALRDAAGRHLASGLYVVRLEAEGRTLTRRLAVIR